MQRQLDDVTQFHRAIGAPVADTPRLLDGAVPQALAYAEELHDMARRAKQAGASGSTLLQRLAMSLEELAEWLEAHGQDDLIAAADAWGDRLYLLFGDAVAAGLPAAEIFSEVHRSNMTKADRPARSDGKAEKTSTFQQPALKEILVAKQSRRDCQPGNSKGGCDETAD